MATLGQQSPPPLPRLREDLCLHDCGRDRTGAERWVIEDYARNRYFAVGVKQLEILRHWAPIDPNEMVERLSQRSGVAVTLADVNALARFLVQNELSEPSPGAGYQSFVDKQKARDGNWSYRYISKYFFMKFPLVNPQHFLTVTYPTIAFMFSRGFLITTLFASLLGAFLVFRQLDTFLTSASNLISFEYLGWFAVALVASKICHELGHGYTALRFGCRVPSMGVALMVFWPVLFTETSDAWKLRDSRQRQFINGAGILTELAIAGYATLLWSFLPDGPVRDAVFYLAVIGWTLSLTVNLNPFMRFDGYYILSDLVGIANLHQRSVEAARWFLRRYLLGLSDHLPETWPSRKRNFVVLFGFLLFLYRLVLFLTIALLVYHFFIKVIGIALFLVEIGYLIVRPVYKEFKMWWTRRSDFALNRRSFLGLTVVGLLIAFLVYPWQSQISGPGLMTGAQFARIYTKSDSQVTAIKVRPGESVTKGQVLFELASPHLALEIQRAEADYRMAEVSMRQALLNVRKSDQFQVFSSERDRVTRLVTDLEAKKTRQTIRAPFDGVVTDLADQLTVGRWLADRTQLAFAVATRDPTVWAYIRESDLRRIAKGAEAWFFSDTPETGPIPLALNAIDFDSTAAIQFPGLIAQFGGPIEAVENESGQYAPLAALYRAQLTVLDRRIVLDRLHHGIVVIDGTRESILESAWRQAASVFVREASF